MSWWRGGGADGPEVCVWGGGGGGGRSETRMTAIVLKQDQTHK